MNKFIIYSFIMYSLWVLVPIIPAVLIYKMFPKAKVSLTGVLSNFKINATGAFAGYLIVLIFTAVYWVGYFQTLIQKSAFEAWNVTAYVKYVDEDGRPMPNQDELINQTSVNIRPFITTQTPKEIKFIAAGENEEITATFISTDPSYPNAYVNLHEDQTKIEDNNITLLDTIIMKKISNGKYKPINGHP